MRDLRFLLPLAVLALALMTACSSDPASVCSASSDCDRGLSCQSDGSCGEAACSSSGDCLNTGDFQETCLQEDSDGAYDADARGVCTDEECRSDRDCPGGEQCISNACYDGTAGPLTCTCRDECGTGEACVQGECTTPLSVCTDTCECPMGSVCEGNRCVAGVDPCQGITCEAGQTCEEGLCVGGTACDPACADGSECVDGSCVPTTVEGGICTDCTDDSDCGGEMDACLVLGDVTACGRSCSDENACPTGFTCLAGNSRTGNQCYPAGGTCGGCLVTGCGTGAFCNPTTTNCETFADTCASCAGDLQCGTGSLCATSGGSDICLTECAGPADCEAGFECSMLGTKSVCAPTGTTCGGTSSCDLGPADCVAPLDVVDTARCICVGCLGDGDCSTGQVCTTAGTCVADGDPCSTTAECNGGYCQGGVCIDCLTPGDCGVEGETCIGGICQDCGCSATERCTATGTCEEVGDPSDCSSDSECVNIARALGYTGENAACDSTIGCYTLGSCNGELIPGIGGEFGGTIDPFDAPCAAGSTCTAQLDFLGGIGGGELFSFACAGCVETNPASCREGETCAAPFPDILGAGPSCGAGGGGFLP